MSESFSVLITNTLNQIKEEGETVRTNLISGNIQDMEEYRFQTGMLAGLEGASQILVGMAQRLYDDEEE